MSRPLIQWICRWLNLPIVAGSVGRRLSKILLPIYRDFLYQTFSIREPTANCRRATAGCLLGVFIANREVEKHLDQRNISINHMIHILIFTEVFSKVFRNIQTLNFREIFTMAFSDILPILVPKLIRQQTMKKIAKHTVVWDILCPLGYRPSNQKIYLLRWPVGPCNLLPGLVRIMIAIIITVMFAVTFGYNLLAVVRSYRWCGQPLYRVSPGNELCNEATNFLSFRLHWIVFSIFLSIVIPCLFWRDRTSTEGRRKGLREG